MESSQINGETRNTKTGREGSAVTIIKGIDRNVRDRYAEWCIEITRNDSMISAK